MSGAIDGFHVYRMDWSPTAISWSVDGTPYARQRLGDWSTPGSSNPQAPFDQPFHLILNLAIGGFGGQAGVDESIFPQKFEIDYVRVYQRD